MGKPDYSIEALVVDVVLGRVHRPRPLQEACSNEELELVAFADNLAVVVAIAVAVVVALLSPSEDDVVLHRHICCFSKSSK